MLDRADVSRAGRSLSDALARMSWPRFFILAAGGLAVAAALPGWPILSWASALALPAAILCALLKVEAGARSRAMASRDEARLEAGAANAKAQSLGARLDPHFLFNAMASIEHLIFVDQEAAAKAQRQLSAYLRSGLSSSEMSTSGAQSAACEAYLELQSMRLGPRLSWSTAWTHALDDAPMLARASMGLIETATAKAIEPLVEGGAIHIASQAEGGGRASWTISFPCDGLGLEDFAPWRSLWLSKAKSPSWSCSKDAARWVVVLGWGL